MYFAFFGLKSYLSILYPYLNGIIYAIKRNILAKIS